MNDRPVIGTDLGGTKVHAARIRGERIELECKQYISSQGSDETVLGELFSAIDAVFDAEVAGIGIGVPSVVNVEQGIVYDVQNIPSWKEVPLKRLVEERYRVPAYINNDANCFAAGEKHFGKGKGRKNLVGLIIGTGMAAGIIIEDKLYTGHNCGAGEFGMIPYLDHHYEYYCSGQFFSTVYGIRGEELFRQAERKKKDALEIFSTYGFHLGNAIIAILYALDPALIVLGGSVSKAYRFFQEALWKRLQTFAYRPVISRLTIEVSEHPDIPVMGAAALYWDSI